MSGNAPFLVESHHPATFRSRGVAAPFTTPMLSGTRIRDIQANLPKVQGLYARAPRPDRRFPLAPPLKAAPQGNG